MPDSDFLPEDLAFYIQNEANCLVANVEDFREHGPGANIVGMHVCLGVLEENIADLKKMVKAPYRKHIAERAGAMSGRKKIHDDVLVDDEAFSLWEYMYLNQIFDGLVEVETPPETIV